MCSNNCDSLSSSLSSLPSSSLSQCKRCASAPSSILLRRRDAYCSACFLAMCAQKFRSTLGKHKTLRKHDEHVLLLFDCSPASIMMTQLFIDNNKLDENDSNRRIRAIPSLLIIDDSVLFPKNELEVRLESALNFDLDIFLVSIEASLASELDRNMIKSVSDAKTRPEPDPSLRVELVKIMESCHDLSSKQSLLRNLRHLCMVKCVQALNFEKMFLSDTSTDIAVSILSGLAEGRGANLPLDVGYQTHLRDHNVSIYRPMREFCPKETIFFNRLMSIDKFCLTSVNAASLSRNDASIERLTERFVLGLQQEYPATISTVFRTGDKLVMNRNESSCKLCLGVVENDSHTFQATELSRRISTNILDNNEEFPGDKKQHELCYACRIAMAKFEIKPQILVTQRRNGIKDLEEYLL